MVIFCSLRSFSRDSSERDRLQRCLSFRRVQFLSAIFCPSQWRIRKLLPQAHSRLFIVSNKASLLIQRGERKKGVELEDEQKGKSKQFRVSSHFSLSSREKEEKKKSIMAHTWILFRAHSHPCTPRRKEKPNYSANLSLAVAGSVLKKTIKQAWINLWQTPYL